MSFTGDKHCFIQLPDFYVFRCDVCYFFHCRLILTQKEDLGFIMNPWSFFFIGYVFSQPPNPKPPQKRLLFAQQIYPFQEYISLNTVFTDKYEIGVITEFYGVIVLWQHIMIKLYNFHICCRYRFDFI